MLVSKELPKCKLDISECRRAVAPNQQNTHFSREIGMRTVNEMLFFSVRRRIISAVKRV
jgi:hypothetical protein